MRGTIYKVTVCEGVIGMIHGCSFEVVEVYIPSKKIAFNEAHDNFNCFITNKDRYNNAIKVCEIEVPKAILQAMTDYISISKRLNKTKKWYKRCVVNGGKK